MSDDIHRKVNPKAKLKTLPEEFQSRIFEVVETGTLEEALEWLSTEMQINVARSTLGDWAGWYRRREFVRECESDVEDLKQTMRLGGGFTPEQIASLSDSVFLNRASKAGDVDTFKIAADISLRGRKATQEAAQHKDKVALAERKLELETAKLENENKKLQMQVAEFEKEKAAAVKVLDTAAGKGASRQLIESVREALNFRPPQEAKP